MHFTQLSSTSPELADTSPELSSTLSELADTSSELANTSPKLANTSPEPASASPKRLPCIHDHQTLADSLSPITRSATADRLLLRRAGAIA